jgi:hypothetical protein
MAGRVGNYVVAACMLTMPLVVGCDSGAGTSGSGTSMDAMASALDAQKNAQQEQARQDAERAAQEAQQAAASAEQPADQNRRVAGREGVGSGGYYTAIVGARRHILNKVESLAWIQGVQHFQATNGRLPKDHAEFMSQIVEPLGIDLGFKEEDQEFLYDPNDKTQGQFGTLYVVAKEPQADAPGGTP